MSQPQDQIVPYRPDMSLRGKLRRRLVRLQHRRPASGAASGPMISFAFDDAPASSVSVGAQLLAERGLRGTYFIASGLAGQHGHAGPYVSAEQLRRVSAQGHEVACHTHAHLDCGQADRRAILADLDRNRRTLLDWGLPEPQTFAYPYGDLNASAKQLVGGRFLLSRGVHHGVIDRGVDLNQAPAVGVEGPHGEGLGREWLKRAHASSGWLILFTHGVGPRSDPFCATTEGLTRLVDEALARGFEVVTVADGARRLRNAA